MEQLLSELQQRGIQLEIEGGELRVCAPPGALDDALRQALREHKPRLLALLRDGQAQATAAAVPIAQDEAGRHESFALTELQRAYWLGRDPAVEMGGVATHLYVEQDCRGIDLARLNEALCRMIGRHHMLRAVLDGAGQQHVLPEVPHYEITATDCSAAGEAEAEAALLATREVLSHQVLQPQHWPLFDIRATLLPGGRMRLHLSLDLLILDASSIVMFLREWRAAYDGEALPPAPRLTFRDCVLAVQAARGGVARAYWEARLPVLPPAPELPLRPGAMPRAPRFRRRELRIPAGRWQALKAEAGRHGLTPSCLVLAAFSEVLARWSASPRFTLSLTSGRREGQHPELQRVLGDFTSVVLHEVDRSRPEQPFAAFAQALQQRLLDDLAHGAFGGIEVRREWARQRGIAPGAAMPVVFSSVLGGNDWRLDSFGPCVHSISQTSQVWLDHHAGEAEGDLLLAWDAVDAVFQPGVLDAMFDSYAALLGRLADDAQAWASANLAELPAAMRRRRIEPAAPQADLSGQALHAGLVAQAQASPRALAVAAPGRMLSRGELLAEAVAVADWLRHGGLTPGEPVAIVMHKGWEQAVAVFGVQLACGAYVPIDADLPPRRQHELLGLCGVRHVLVQPGSLHAQLQAGPWQVHTLHAGLRAPFGERHAQSLQGAQGRTAYVIFTSGTTGVPKGVMIDHRGAHNTVAAVNRMFGVGPADAVLGLSSLSFDLSVYDIFGVPGAGGTLVLPEAGLGHDPQHWCELLRAHGVTLWNSAPQLMRMLLDSLAPGATLPGALRTVLLSGDFIPLDTADRLRRHGCGAELVSLGGATEASIWSVFHRVREVDPAWRSIPYGRALPNQTMSVLDHALRPTPDHVRGRIHIGGIGLAQGYLGDAACTAQRFITHPATGERLYDTGDLGCYAEDGSLVILGRDDRQVKIRGHRVELGEIEAALRRHPAVAQAVVLAPAADGDARQLVAYVQPQPGMQPGAETLRQHAADHLPDHMVPRRIVLMAQLPLSANGKLDLRALPEPADAGVHRVAPRNDTERAILAIWTRVMPSTEIGVTDNFFELGGDSVLATQLLRELNAALPVALQMHELFEHVTVEALATLVGERAAAGATAAPTPRLAAADALQREAAAVRTFAAGLPLTPPPARHAPATVLLTGATGWVGAHLLAELLHATPARVVCLVRDADAQAARARLLVRLRQWQLRFDEAALGRIEVLHADLQHPRFGLDAVQWSGLCDRIDAIYHLAASVNVLHDYETHRRHNIEPLHDLLRLATDGRVKPLVALSPGTVCRRRIGGQLRVLDAGRMHDDAEGLPTAYAQSKWVAEQLLWAAAQRGLPVRLYRCAHALPSAASGLSKPGDSCTAIFSLAAQVGTVPDWPEARVTGLPVDALCRWLLRDAMRAPLQPALVPVEHQTPAALASVLQLLVQHRQRGAAAASEPLQAWRQRCLAAAQAGTTVQAGLARLLFEARDGTAPVEHMFDAPRSAAHLAGPDGTDGLVALTPVSYWQRAFAALHEAASDACAS